MVQKVKTISKEYHNIFVEYRKRTQTFGVVSVIMFVQVGHWEEYVSRQYERSWANIPLHPSGNVELAESSFEYEEKKVRWAIPLLASTPASHSN